MPEKEKSKKRKRTAVVVQDLSDNDGSGSMDVEAHTEREMAPSKYSAAHPLKKRVDDDEKHHRKDSSRQVVVESLLKKKKSAKPEKSKVRGEDDVGTKDRTSAPIVDQAHVTKKSRKDGNLKEEGKGNAKRNAAVKDSEDESEDSAVEGRPTKTYQEDAMEIDDPVDKNSSSDLNTSKPSALFKPKKGRDWTLSIALPGSFIANTKSIEQKNSLAARIARAAAVFCVDEVIIFDDDPSTLPHFASKTQIKGKKTKADLLAGVGPDQEPWDNPDQFLFHVLSYLECPPHLRVALFPHHPNLRGCGAMPSLDMPHHSRPTEWTQYREGVTVEVRDDFSTLHSNSRRNKASTPEEFSYVDCGIGFPVRVPYAIPLHMRVTLKFANADPPPRWPKITQQIADGLNAEPVLASTPREEAGYYWGYTIRRAESLSEVFIGSPYEDGYDYTLGTSERGVRLSSLLPDRRDYRFGSEDDGEPEFVNGSLKLPTSFKHLLLVIGGVQGLEPAVVSDPILKEKGFTKEKAHEAFDGWVDLVPGQGSRTIRTEEAVWLALMGTREYVEGNV
ncbi:putative RNA methyltransferase-domain-containing protein [Clohesyomyces aquaticus]|uniref:Putative RNA methyltransferase-domain-containing protein n=1 Tax=Clohesyomyces aquaticus TaxID=1231657 RepID=A0A1Y1ZK82_9PLEO|nr:putative RNA methyltransferase-domain-containing protein [Clohesyomyces aquaticus]